ncbi:hypothetical protein [Candidatus Avelusimicrobium caledoniensis]|jgi:hypothetical protein|uniref:hypothetical protein n=1 Tax=Candidatus Avelusimicrobium caledoniensis TaxID=3416220 RepID=UPI003D0BB9EC
MNIKTKVLLACLAVGFCGANATASINENAGTSAAAFLKIGAGAPAATALGNAYVSIADGPQALYWNPAGAASATTREIGFTYLDYLQGYKARTLAYLQPIGKTIIGVSLNYMDMDDFDFRDKWGHQLPEVGVPVQNFVGGISIARGFINQKLQLGGTAKYISERLYNGSGHNHYDNIGFDVGAKLRLVNWLGLGGALVNIGDKDDMPNGLRLGADLDTRYFTISGEYMKYKDDNARYGVGLAVHIPEDLLQVARFDLRVGYYTRENTGVNTEDSWVKDIGLQETSKVSFGFGIYSSELFGYGASIDYSVTPFGALGTSQQLAVSVQF